MNTSFIIFPFLSLLLFLFSLQLHLKFPKKKKQKILKKKKRRKKKRVVGVPSKSNLTINEQGKQTRTQVNLQATETINLHNSAETNLSFPQGVIYFKGRETNRQLERKMGIYTHTQKQTEFFHLLLCVPNAHQGMGWDRTNQETRNSI